MVSPLDLKKACVSFEKLGLPLRLRDLKSGVTVVESAMASEEQVDERMKAVVADKGETTVRELLLSGACPAAQQVMLATHSLQAFRA